MTHGHFKEECKHGILIRQCKCPSREKAVRVVACPNPDEHEYRERKDAVIAEVTKKVFATREQILDEVYEELRLALRDANNDHAHKLKILENPYCSHEQFEERREAFGFARGIARSMEIVEKLIQDA